MQVQSEGKIETYIARAKDAELRSRNESDGEAKLAWVRIAASWRLLAERTLIERTGGELLLH